MNKILIIDDEVQIRSLLARMLELEGYEVCQAGDCKTAIKQLEIQSPDVALCDVFLPDGNGVDLVLNIKKIAPNVEVILLTAHGNIPDGVQAIKNGAFDYITKGDDNNKIIPLISRAVEKAKMNVRLEKLEKKVGQMYSFDSILGESKVLKESVSLAQKVSVTDVPVLLTGETGTGKEVFAQAIHYNSKRSKQNFVAVNCSSFSKELLESEMFGHKAGSFTGALKDKKGLFEEANNGTIFLDEIGEMAFELQAKLLRILETGEYIKIGDTKPTRVNVRIIAATNRNLQEEIKAGHFREDLFYRLSVFQVHLPSLRERTGDIRILATAFAKSVLPVPGGPTSSTPFGILAPTFVYFCGDFRKSTTSARSSFSSCRPATLSKVTFLLSSGDDILARLLPKFIIFAFPPPPPPAIWRFIIMIRKITRAPVRRTGSKVVRNTLSPGTSWVVISISYLFSSSIA